MPRYDEFILLSSRHYIEEQVRISIRCFEMVMNTVIAFDSDSTALFETPNLTGTPERRLLLAILERAILDYVGNDSKEVLEAGDWLFTDGEQKAMPAFSFP